MECERPETAITPWRKLSDTERDVFVTVLALHADESSPNGKAVKATLQQQRSVTQPTVYRALRNLCDAGWLKKDHGERDGRMAVYSATEQAVNEFVTVRSTEYDIVETVVEQMFPAAP